MHRDVKIDNVFVMSDEPDLKVKIADFGISAFKTHAKEHIGTEVYLAPDIYKVDLEGGSYSNKVDIFCLGELMFILLLGYPPFKKKDHTRLLDFSSIEWDPKPSEKAIDLLKKMLAHEDKDRISAKEALQHPFFSKYNKNNNSTTQKHNKSTVINKETNNHNTTSTNNTVCNKRKATKLNTKGHKKVKTEKLAISVNVMSCQN